MIVCHCRGVSDRAIRKAVREGAADLREVGAACGAGSCCGGCAGAVQEIIHTEFATARDDGPAAIPTVSALPT